MGIGDGLIPDILDQGIYDDICVVSDEEAINEARALAREEGLLCGGIGRYKCGCRTSACSATWFGQDSGYFTARYGRTIFFH